MLMHCFKICFFYQMVTVNSLQAIYKLLSAPPDTTALSKQLSAQLINVRMQFTKHNYVKLCIYPFVSLL